MSKLDLVPWKRDYFDPATAHKLHDFGMVMWLGYKTPIREHEHEILMTCEITHKLLQVRDLHSLMSGFSFRELKDKYVGQIVITTYNNRKYKVHDIDFEKNPQCKIIENGFLGCFYIFITLATFRKRDGTTETFVDYIRKRYPNVTVDINMKQPLLVSLPDERGQRRGDNQPIYLIPQLCFATGIPEDLRKDSFQMRVQYYLRRICKVCSEFELMIFRN